MYICAKFCPQLTSALCNVAISISYSAEVARKAGLAEDGLTKVAETGALKLNAYGTLTDVSPLVGCPMGENATLEEIEAS